MIKSYLKRRLPSLTAATLCTLLLGLVSALTFAMVGPAVQILSDPQRTAPVSLVELFGQRLGEVFSQLLGRSSFSMSELWQELPQWVLGAAALRAALAMSQWFLWERSSELIAREMRQNLVDSYLGLEPEARRDRAGLIDREIAAGVSNDIRMVREYLVHFLGGFPRELVQVLFYLVTLFMLEPMLASLFLVGLGPAAALLSRLSKKLRKRSQAVLDNSSDLVEWLQQRLSGAETIKQYRTEQLEIERLNRSSERLFQLFVRAARAKARTSPLMEIVAVAAMMGVLAYALREIASGSLNSSILLSFFAVLGVLSQSAAKLGRYFNSNKEGEAALSRLGQLFASMREHEKLILPREEGSAILELEELSYRYAGSDQLALGPLSQVFEAGRIYAIAGPSGSGKSTLLKLILGLWRAQSGHIRYGFGADQKLGYMPQSVVLAPGTLISNIVYPHQEFDADRAREALQRVALDVFVAGLSRGWDSSVGEGGEVTLSGGQAQRIMLARLIYHRYPLVIIDEGTSALDPETEALVLRTFRDMARDGATLVMVAHRLAVLKIADELIVLKRGEVFFRGSPRRGLEESDWREFFDVRDELVGQQSEPLPP